MSRLSVLDRGSGARALRGFAARVRLPSGLNDREVASSLPSNEPRPRLVMLSRSTSRALLRPRAMDLPGPSRPLKTDPRPPKLPFIESLVGRRVGSRIAAGGLFCGVSGLTRSLQEALIHVVTDVVPDPHARYAYERNNGVTFLERVVCSLSSRRHRRVYPEKSVRPIASCAPSTPHSPHRDGTNSRSTRAGQLLDEFARRMADTNPPVVIMENVPKLKGSAIYWRSVMTHEVLGYSVDAKNARADLGGTWILARPSANKRNRGDPTDKARRRECGWALSQRSDGVACSA